MKLAARLAQRYIFRCFFLSYHKGVDFAMKALRILLFTAVAILPALLLFFADCRHEKRMIRLN